MAEERHPHRLLRSGVIAGVLMMLMAPVGIIATILGMSGAFEKMPMPTTDPGAVMEPIGEVLIPTFVGIAVAIAGVILFTICRARLRAASNAPPNL